MHRKPAGAAFFIVTLLACATAGAASLAGLWLDVPFVEQQKDGCGAASIAMVMQYWDQHLQRPISPDAEPVQILRAIYEPAAHGIYASAMKSYFQQNGYRAIEFSGEWADLARQLQNGRPLIVSLKTGSGPSLHYVVVVGLDIQQRLVLVNDPAQRKLLSEDQSMFEHEWKAAGHWTLLAVPEAPGR